ncbi:MAG TPA: alanine--tRNA ligase [Bacteroidales bacterium]|nr:alanine--tRNA ligase [Bacteroidales bacterium]
MKSAEIRKTFLEFFSSKQHSIVPSAPMVVKNDPTLMFTNAGMNQFKDCFLGNSIAPEKRVADTQKCLRVSGKHNDLEEVGHDTYHHTMFEMLGNWSFGDYFKKEAIEWAWELLTVVFKIHPDSLYVTIFEGDTQEGLSKDEEAYEQWKKIVPVDRILMGSKKDNFWEMGDTGPCGPCSEIHVDLRNDEEKLAVNGRELVNKGHPLVIEIWNLVFIEFNRKADGSLVSLPAKHVDTGMGFERLCMALQKVRSNYDTDVFQPLIQQIALLAGCRYGEDAAKDVAMRVIADHLRAIAFAIADGQLPSNNKAGYVIRRILRRAVRYGYTFLGFKEPFIHSLVPLLVSQMGETFPELPAQKDLIGKVMAEEEAAFLRTLDMGIHKFEHYKIMDNKVVDGQFAFELFDTYGFPVDLTQLMAREKGWTVDMVEFAKCMEEQKKRSRQAAVVDKEDWVVIAETTEETDFVGYTQTMCEARVVKYRKIKAKDKEQYQLVLDKTPFYAESGGQTGDRGTLEFGGEKVSVTDTKKENNLIIHLTSTLPQHLEAVCVAKIDLKKRRLTQNNHTATHLLHKALRDVVGSHVEQKGSYVSDDRLRFDFSHFTGVTTEEQRKIEKIIFEKISENLPVNAETDTMENARKKGAIALFGEKYGNEVRMITVGDEYSRELCGGTHVNATGQIGLFIIVEETAVAAGVRRIEAITGETAFDYIFQQYLDPLNQIKSALKKPYAELPATVSALMENNASLKKQVEGLQREKAQELKNSLKTKAENVNGINFIAEQVDVDTASIKDIVFSLKNDIDRLFVVLGNVSEGKVSITLMISDDLVEANKWNASKIIRDFAKEIQGGGGGQDFYATAGGKNPAGLTNVFSKAREFVALSQCKQ